MKRKGLNAPIEQLLCPTRRCTGKPTLRFARSGFSVKLGVVHINDVDKSSQVGKTRRNHAIRNLFVFPILNTPTAMGERLTNGSTTGNNAK